MLIQDTHFPTKASDLRWNPGAVELVHLLIQRGIKVGVATNQSGVARGYFYEPSVQRFHGWMQDQLRAQGAWIDHFEYCPHHPTDGQVPYLTACECRKPAPGMLRAILERFQVPAARALMVGDRVNDLQAADRAGMASLLFGGGNVLEVVQSAGWLGGI